MWVLGIETKGIAKRFKAEYSEYYPRCNKRKNDHQANSYTNDG